MKQIGRYFTDCLRSDIESLRFYGRIHEQYRGFYRLLAKRFPFSIFCKMTDGWIEIYAILDARQDPRRIDTLLESRKTN
ncbi:MAG: type II toxin-antitoxin system RelE/ParE family toxin [Planctomycetota bacterium]|nr:type II toxin-antitoxin system RelE/ParE family toxin [Planctomycetota bacterium]